MDLGTSLPPPPAPQRGHMRYVWMVSLIAAIGGLLFGYDFVVIGGAKPFFEKYFLLKSEWLSGWANSCALLGCLAGALGPARLSDKFGRKKLLIVAAVLFAASSSLTGWAPTFSWFVVWRLLGGVAIGMTSNVAPVYIAEVAPARLRGRFVAIYQLTIFIGFVVGQTANWLIAERMPDLATAEFIRQSWNGQYGWRWMFTAVSAPSLVFLLAGMILPESPRWLVKNGRNRRALACAAVALWRSRRGDAIAGYSANHRRRRGAAGPVRGPPGTQNAQDPAPRRVPGGAPAVERPERDFQLCGRGLPRGRLRA